jgi:hypothetical protein
MPIAINQTAAGEKWKNKHLNTDRNSINPSVYTNYFTKQG